MESICCFGGIEMSDNHKGEVEPETKKFRVFSPGFEG